CERCAAIGPVAALRQHQLEEGEVMSIVVAYPEGTFDGVAPVLVGRVTWRSCMGWAGPAGIVAALVALIGGAGVICRARTRGRDRAYLDLTPGLYPTSPESGRVGPARRRPVAGQFTPPAGGRAGGAGTLPGEAASLPA